MFIRQKSPQKDVIENPRTLTAHDKFDSYLANIYWELNCTKAHRKKKRRERILKRS